MLDFTAEGAGVDAVGVDRHRSSFGAKRRGVEEDGAHPEGVESLNNGVEHGAGLHVLHREPVGALAGVSEKPGVGISEFILSGWPHLEEAYWFGEGVLPELRRRGRIAPA